MPPSAMPAALDFGARAGGGGIGAGGAMAGAAAMAGAPATVAGGGGPGGPNPPGGEGIVMRGRTVPQEARHLISIWGYRRPRRRPIGAHRRLMATQFRIGDSVPRDAVEDACGELGFRLSNVVARTDSHPAQSIYATPDRLTLLHLVDDAAAGRAAVLRGARAEELTSRLLRALAGATAPREPDAAAGSSGSGAGEGGEAR